MSGRDVRAAANHERARELAAARIDELLDPADEAWLADHLEVCEDCAVIAAQYDAQHGLFAALRQTTPQPPRDLWARTASRIENERRAARGGSRWRLPRRSPGRSTLSLAPVIAAVAIVAVVGAGLLNGRVALPGGTAAAATPMAIKGAADLQVLTVDSAGNLQLLSRRVDQVCPTGVTECGVSPTFAVTAVSPFGSASDLLGAMSPTGDQLVVVRRDPGSQGVYVVPFKRTASPSPSGSTNATASATSSHPVASATPTAKAPSSASPSPSASAGHESAPPATIATRTTEPSGSPHASPRPSESPLPSEATASASPAERSPEPSGSASPVVEVSVQPSPTASDETSAAPSVEVTPAPDAAIKIASGVTVVGAPTYSPDGSHLAFSAMPADGLAGPDIYVWAVGDPAAQAITTDHDSWLAGWTSDGILVSRVSEGLPTTYRLDPATGEAVAVGEPGMWLPSVSPTGATAGWWSGTVKLAADGVTWVPDQGQLVLGAWPSLASAATATGSPAATVDGASASPDVNTPTPTPTATPTATASATVAASGDSPAASTPTPLPTQTLVAGPLDAWRIRWDDTGEVVAVWVGQGSGEIGRLSLYAVDPTTGVPDLANPMLDLAATDPDFSLRSGRLAWITSDQGSPQTVGVVAWSGRTVYPPMELPADVSGTVIP